MRPLDAILADFRATLAAVAEEERRRTAIMASSEYRNLQLSIENAQALQAAMLAKVPDTREEHQADKRELMAFMQEHRLSQAEEFEAKIRVRKEVNTRKVMDVLGGDLDSFFLLAKIQQNTLKDFMAANKVYAKALRHCVEEVGTDVVDVLPIEEELDLSSGDSAVPA